MHKGELPSAKSTPPVVYVFSFRRKCCSRNGPFRVTFTVRQTCKGSSRYLRRERDDKWQGVIILHVTVRRRQAVQH